MRRLRAPTRIWLECPRDWRDQPRSGSGAKTRVVVAEDEVLIRLDLVEMLSEEGYDVVGQASDGEAAVALTTDLGLIWWSWTSRCPNSTGSVLQSRSPAIALRPLSCLPPSASASWSTERVRPAQWRTWSSLSAKRT